MTRPGYYLPGYYFPPPVEKRIFPANVETTHQHYLFGTYPTPKVFPANVGQTPSVTGVGKLYVGIPGPKGDKGEMGDPGVVISPTAPSNPAVGQLWVDTS